MGIFNLFKKKLRKNNVEKISFSEIESWIENKIGENKVKENEIISIIKDKIKTYNNELNEKILLLENFDVEGKKEKEHIKEIVNSSRKDYIESVENFLESLNNLKINDFEEFMKKVNKIFLDFNKSSYKNYERATILIGKEMKSIKESVKIFSGELLEIYEKNKDVVDFFKTISQIKSEYENLNLTENTLNTIIEKRRFLNKKINEKEEENRILNQKIKEIKESQNHLDFLASQRKLESLKSETKRDILELRQVIDFKSLANFFHMFPEQMKIAKNHKEDFYKLFLEDNGESIIGLLEEAKLNNNEISEKIKKIHSKLKETANCEQEIKKDETQELYPKIKEIITEIDNLKIEDVKEEKREKKYKENKRDLTSSLKQELGKMNVEIE